MPPRITAIVLAAGLGKRLEASTTKQRITLGGKSILRRSLEIFEACGEIADIVVVTREDELDFARNEASDISKVIGIVRGGETRAESARNGFFAVPAESEYVAIHDAARCFTSQEDLKTIIRDAVKHGAATASTPVVDTVKMVSNSGFIESTLDRDSLRAVQTPQIFEAALYRRALESVPAFGARITDDCSLVEHIWHSVFCSNTSASNIKITTRNDLDYADFLLRGDGEVSQMRIGQGYDVHRLALGRALILGGVEIPYEKGLLGHSDADVLLHAIMDAVLGALALGDIGKHFPDTDARYSGISSLKLLEQVKKLMEGNEVKAINIDSTIVMQKPKLAPYIDKMRDNIARALELPLSNVSVKATTEERLGFTGREEGVAAYATVLLIKNKALG